MNILFNITAIGAEYAPSSGVTDGAFDSITVAPGAAQIHGYYVVDVAFYNSALAASTWTFPPFAGIVSSSSSYASGVTGGSGNSQVAALMAGRMSKSFTVDTTGNYQVNFNAALSPLLDEVNSVIPQSVTCGIFSGTDPANSAGYANLGTFALNSATYSPVTSGTVALTSGVSYSLVFSSGAWRQLSSDYILIDNVSVNQIS